MKTYFRQTFKFHETSITSAKKWMKRYFREWYERIHASDSYTNALYTMPGHPRNLSATSIEEYRSGCDWRTRTTDPPKAGITSPSTNLTNQQSRFYSSETSILLKNFFNGGKSFFKGCHPNCIFARPMRNTWPCTYTCMHNKNLWAHMSHSEPTQCEPHGSLM